MPRRKITSTTKKKADQKLKRAIKRGEAPPPEPQKKVSRRLKRRIAPRSSASDPSTIESARKLQSAFIKLPPDFLEQTKQLSSRLPLLRPIPDEKAVFHSFDHTGEPDFDALICPKRPKWRFDMSKLEVERNEEGLFKEYLSRTDKALEKWQNKSEPSESQGMPRSPSYFERNPEIWRQLWRVTEISQIILVLLDSRCPLLHYPPSLSNYLGDRKVILVLTKVDIAGPARVQSWIKYLEKHYPDSRIVQVESYVEKDVSSDHQGHKQQEPSIPEHFRANLVEILKKAHEELLVPPENIASNPDRLKNWIPPVKREINWDGVMQAKGSKVGVAIGDGGAPRPHSPFKHEDIQDNQHQQQEPGYLTVGLIGQPNVGKSSLLNALFGARRVRASKTPGKTKHFQTLYWTPDVRLVDCPGLVMPNYVPMEMQILCGIYPISRVSAVPSCIYYASQLLPLEKIFNLPHPSRKFPPAEDKRTWRDNKPREGSHDPETPPWTAMDILTTYADAKGWVTAKSGRIDIHRAGNAILRSLAEGRVGWAFWPPGTPPEEIAAAGGGGQGIWIPRADRREDRSDSESEDDEIEEHANQSTSSEQEEDEEEHSGLSEDDDTIDAVANAGVGRFNALAINEVEEDEDENEDEDEEEESG